MIFASRTATQKECQFSSSTREWWRRPKAAVNLIQHCLDDRENGIVLLGVWSSYEHVDHLLTCGGVRLHFIVGPTAILIMRPLLVQIGVIVAPVRLSRDALVPLVVCLSAWFLFVTLAPALHSQS